MLLLLLILESEVFQATGLYCCWVLPQARSDTIAVNAIVRNPSDVDQVCMVPLLVLWSIDAQVQGVILD